MCVCFFFLITLCFAFVHTELTSQVQPMEVQIRGKMGILASNAKSLPWCLQYLDCVVQISFHRWETHRLERLVAKVLAYEAVADGSITNLDDRGISGDFCSSPIRQRRASASTAPHNLLQRHLCLHCPGQQYSATCSS